MYKQWTAEFTGITILAILALLPVGIVCAARDNEWTLIALFVAAIGLDLRVKRAGAHTKAQEGA